MFLEEVIIILIRIVSYQGGCETHRRWIWLPWRLGISRNPVRIGLKSSNPASDISRQEIHKSTRLCRVSIFQVRRSINSEFAHHETVEALRKCRLSFICGLKLNWNVVYGQNQQKCWTAVQHCSRINCHLRKTMPYLLPI